jgi:ABC-2 type transport system ATP-binding protein
VPAGLDLLPGVHAVEVTDHRVSAQVEPSGLAPLLQSLTAAGLYTLTSHPPSLEELFLRHYGVSDDGTTPTVADVTQRSPHV